MAGFCGNTALLAQMVQFMERHWARILKQSGNNRGECPVEFAKCYCLQIFATNLMSKEFEMGHDLMFRVAKSNSHKEGLGYSVLPALNV